MSHKILNEHAPGEHLQPHREPHRRSGMRSHSLICLFATALMALFAFAPQAYSQELSLDQQRVIERLRQLDRALEKLADERLRIQMQARLADVLWAYDEVDARRSFETAFHAIEEIKPKRAEHNFSFLSPEQVKLRLRREVLGLILRHDARLARQLVESLPDRSAAAPESAPSGEPSENARAVLLSEITQSIWPSSVGEASTASSLSPGVTETSEPTGQSLIPPPSARPEQTMISLILEGKDEVRQAELWQAMNDDHFDRALSLLKEIADAAVRAELDAIIRLQAVMRALEKADYAAAFQRIQALPTLAQRVFLSAHLSVTLWEKKDYGRALEAITEAQTWGGKIEDERERCEALSQLAGAVARCDPARSFEILETAIEALNRAERDDRNQESDLIEPDAPLLHQSFVLLARSNFDRAWQLAQMIEKQETSAQAQLAACLGALKPLTKGLK